MLENLKFTLRSVAISASANVSAANPAGYVAAVQLVSAVLLATAQVISLRLRRPRRTGWRAESRRLRKDAPRNVLQHRI